MTRFFGTSRFSASTRRKWQRRMAFLGGACAAALALGLMNTSASAVETARAILSLASIATTGA
ncbi:hypothetical protein [Breoghania sp. JC706]|uniref:hypothetical protein n=1 Tax=Breoghania sp. JC706 TaxID=3117732 RepID=UPI0030091451